jgi:hypothetical protein
MFKNFYAALISVALLATNFRLLAQDDKVGTWGIVTVTLPGDSTHRWGAYTELQTRTNTLFNQAFYYEIKGGISFDIANNYTALIGTGRYITYDYNDLDAPPTAKETRLWEQMVINQFLDRIKIEHRYRVEQRFFETGYRNRFRYRLNIAIPLNHRKFIANTWYVAAFNEIFINNRAPHFERNRLSAGLGYQFTKSLTLQTAWTNQYNYSQNKGSAKNNLAINLMYRFSRKNTTVKEYLPSSYD